jgi:hypothetical protein
MVTGLTFGVIALFGIREHGVRGILLPALIGIALNGLLLIIFIGCCLVARANA